MLRVPSLDPGVMEAIARQQLQREQMAQSAAQHDASMANGFWQQVPALTNHALDTHREEQARQDAHGVRQQSMQQAQQNLVQELAAQQQRDAARRQHETGLEATRHGNALMRAMEAAAKQRQLAEYQQAAANARTTAANDAMKYRADKGLEAAKVAAGPGWARAKAIRDAAAARPPPKGSGENETVKVMKDLRVATMEQAKLAVMAEREMLGPAEAARLNDLNTKVIPMYQQWLRQRGVDPEPGAVSGDVGDGDGDEDEEVMPFEPGYQPRS